MLSKPVALVCPLKGSQLIEASAGTGKTFAISILYLRLILGHGCDESDFYYKLLPSQILVVTFTNAATKDLRKRIRDTLAKAARFFREEIKQPDVLIADLRNQYPPDQWQACAKRLDIAAQLIDEAAILTIHSWCQRMLREHSLDSGSLFTQTLKTDHSDLLSKVVRDYWRLFCYSMHGDELNWVRKNWRDPEALMLLIQVQLGSAQQFNDTRDPGDLIKTCLQERRKALVSLKAPWKQWAAELREICLQAVVTKAVDGRKMQARYFEPWFEKISAWAVDDTLEQLDIGTGFTRLTPHGMADAWNGNPPYHAGINAMVGLKVALDTLPTPNAALLQHATSWVSKRFKEEKHRCAEFGFDDMLSHLNAALQTNSGERLASAIRKQFPVVMIDEFQDTNPEQYSIFNSIYRIEKNYQNIGLFLIGDPKQAIYSFRGANIYTYLHARQYTTGRHHTLSTNFRSSHAMVEAVNYIFQRAETGRGAFLFREPNGDNPVPFHSALSEGCQEQLLVNGHMPPAMNFWYLPTDEPISNSVYRHQLAAACATQIVKLLHSGQQGITGFIKNSTFKSILQSDIAILVRDGKEAKAIRAELSSRGVRSVYLSDHDSVFASQEACDLLVLLKACAEPGVERLLRAALACATLNLSLSELECLNDDELALEASVILFRGYQIIWRNQGVLPMLRRLLYDFKLPQKLNASSDGERVLTNLLHLSELLQIASLELNGEQALIRYLARHLKSSGQVGEEQILRLESDEKQVTIVTIHKSKGLEYGLVFLPFICSVKPVDGSILPLRYCDKQGGFKVSLQPTAELIAKADDERLAEDLRLLYVALTRAKHACWLGIADLKRSNNNSSVLHLSALGYLLGFYTPLDKSASLEYCLQSIQEGCTAIHYTYVPDIQNIVFRPPRNDATLLAPLLPKRRVSEKWSITSYSALRIDDRINVANLDASESSQAKKMFNKECRDHDTSREVVTHGDDIHYFPRGSNSGTFLHGLLEWAGKNGFNLNPEAIKKAVRTSCIQHNLEGWLVTINDWLSHLLKASLPAGNDVFTLSGLKHYQIEMEFWFASHKVDILTIDKLVCQYTHNNVSRVAAKHFMLNGMFKGFLDLVFEHDGRYYVVDYKSNWLGYDDSSYTFDAMEQSILKHRYDLQYALYLLAMHRHLKARLSNYDYDRYVGGVLYLFLRGTRAVSHGVFFTHLPRELIQSLDLLFQGKSILSKTEPTWTQEVLL
ncbi:exodeoxyribonuclease V subunit beta [Candidatus Pseudomonas adelgestsugas]|uniref:RecBCD enzyme subunit RecB n=1 Tax=Candidatus Pseudomonas adelgestsugas TaxID=1302376 RepID=A0ABX5R9K0_9PSED|nr:exodeoxyribonuclease V subunit beta [Candidatus Pseudomonas adelgestsugas]QAX82286.1 RecBCD enzyme subunit RecB [Candidatus Pseudomonas adelgestsugas]